MTSPSRCQVFCLTSVGILKIVISMTLVILLINGYIDKYENAKEITRYAAQPMDLRGPWQNMTFPRSSETISSLRKQSPFEHQAKSSKPLLYFLCGMHFSLAIAQFDSPLKALTPEERDRKFSNGYEMLIFTCLSNGIVFVARFVPSLVECRTMLMFFSLDTIRLLYLAFADSIPCVHRIDFV